MFRSKRSNLVKRLWRLRSEKNESSREDENVSDVTKNVTHSMLKRLRETQLDNLIKSIESKGLSSTECVMVPKEILKLGKRMVKPHVLCCQLWRWPDLPGEHAIKRLHSCKPTEDLSSICCNPFHWGRLIPPDTPPPPYKATISESSPQKMPGCVVSTETGLTPSAFQQLDGSSGSSVAWSWCHVAYWELRERVGPLYSVQERHVNVFDSLPQPHGMCLAQIQSPPLAMSNQTNQSGSVRHTGHTGQSQAALLSGSHQLSSSAAESIERVRTKIGAGVTLWLEDDATVWLHNRSQFPVFVNSPTLELPNSRATVVKKVPSGYTLQIFDFERSEEIECVRDPQFLDGPYDPHSIRISFAKGWGPHYSRQFITSCPCWIEVLLRINR